MSSSPITKLNRKLNQDDFVKHHLEQMTAMFAILHGGLSEILKCEMSASGAIDMKAIAEISLVETQRIALTLGGNTNAEV